MSKINLTLLIVALVLGLIAAISGIWSVIEINDARAGLKELETIYITDPFDMQVKGLKLAVAGLNLSQANLRFAASAACGAFSAAVSILFLSRILPSEQKDWMEKILKKMNEVERMVELRAEEKKGD